MFQILFDYEMLAEIPRANFLPWRSSKLAYGGKVVFLEIDFDFKNHINWKIYFCFRLNTMSTCFT